jgi:hypothetical protein
MRSGAGRNEDTGADDRADSEGSELNGAEDTAKAVFAFHFLEQQLQRLARKETHRR